MPTMHKNKRLIGKKRRMGGRAKFKRYGAKAGSVAYSALKLAKRIARVVNTEHKFYDNNQATSVDYSGALYTINTPTQGVSVSQRVGDSIKMLNCTLRGGVFWNSAGNPIQMVRLIVFFDKENSTSGVNDILESSWTSSGNAPFSPKNWDKQYRTKILFDKTYQLDLYHPQVLFNELIPLDMHTEFESGTASIDSGALTTLLISNVNSNVPTCSYVSRVTYVDN